MVMYSRRSWNLKAPALVTPHSSRVFVEFAYSFVEIRAIQLGDQTLSVMEIWGAEYQENDALLLKKEQSQLFADLCQVHPRN